MSRSLLFSTQRNAYRKVWRSERADFVQRTTGSLAGVQGLGSRVSKEVPVGGADSRELK